MTPLENIQQCIIDEKCFVLQGGAGSGKTETLKQVLEYISINYPDKKVACITHTNLAVNEIKSRVGEEYTISTIHSFLNSNIKDFKKNIFQCIFELFRLEKMERSDLEHYDGDETLQKKKEHNKYKKKYEKYSTKLFTIKNERIAKVKGKRVYDVDPESYNLSLNNNIDVFNDYISEEIATKDYNKIKYNETIFNSYKDLTFGHNGLLDISYLLFSIFPRLGKILQDKYDFIFIDEYQDTNEKIIEIFLNYLPQNNKKTIIGLFGDSMQAIYNDGIGDVENYVDEDSLVKIMKEDNYRCSEQVVPFINQLRYDNLEQEIALKYNETIEERQGSVNVYYQIYDNKPHVRSSLEDKEIYINTLNQLISYAKRQQPNSKLLMLTNKSISIEANFNNLYNVFAKLYQDPKEYIDKVLERLQFKELVDICEAYECGNYNFILNELQKSDYSIKTIADKRKLKEDIENIINSTSSAIETLNLAFQTNIIKKSETNQEYLNKKEEFYSNLDDIEYPIFKENYNSGNNTYTRMRNVMTNIIEEDFKELEREVKKDNFYITLYSNEIEFQEIINYYKYINEDLDYITMHKTKGSSIDNVIVVLDEYFWNDYNFSEVFDSEIDTEKKLNSQKLVYVACSRTKTNLTCIKLINSEEEILIQTIFPNCERIEI